MGELINILGTISDSQISQNIARDTETADAIAAHEQKAAPHPGHMPINPTGIEMGFGSVNILDFHTGVKSTNDYDARILAFGGTEVTGSAQLSFLAANFTFAGSVQIGNSAATKLREMLVVATILDPPLIAAGSFWSTTISITGARVGDFCAASGNLYTNPCMLNAAVTASNVVTIYIRNFGSTSVDLPAFAVQILVIGF